MQIIESIEAMQSLSLRLSQEGKRIGLVPTMGALHEGHLSLIDGIRERVDVVVVSIFVNPAQFGPNEDFEKYPRTLEVDLSACESRKADIVFLPSKEAVYPEGFSTYINEEVISHDLCGRSRPGHFRGVTTIVSILFNIVRPSVAIFGQKDAQQTAIIRKMVKDLCLPIEVVAGETVRESNGLAMSSRNQYLAPDERAEAGKLYETLLSVQKMVREGGVRSVERIQAELTHQLSRGRRIRIIYSGVVDAESFLPVKEVVSGKTLVAVAIWLGQTRLIDNILL